MRRTIAGITLSVLCLLLLSGCRSEPEPQEYAAKPVLYLYPVEEMDISVLLDLHGRLTTTYPDYRDGWHVTAKPDGTLIDLTDGRAYSYLFWEGETGAQYDLSQGFVVAGSDTAAFLQDALEQLGLTPREYNEFIVYWLPQMQDNPYNLITFQGESYTQCAQLTIQPEPDSLLRVFMAWMPLEQPVQIQPQTLQPFTRTGFTAVEWGGTQLSPQSLPAGETP